MKKVQISDNEIIDIAKECSKLLIEKKAKDVLLLDLRKVNSYLDYFVITTGNSFIHCKALAMEMQKFFKSNNLKERTKSRLDTGWIALDFNEIVIHIFTEEMRAFYQLEKLWADADFLDY